MALEQIEGEMAEDGEIFGGVVETDATGIFAKGDDFDIELSKIALWLYRAWYSGKRVSIRNTAKF